jgi:heme exporter protein B
MSFLGATIAVLVKDLSIEIRSREIVLSTVLFAVLVVLLSAFAFDVSFLSTGGASAGVLWIAISFSGMLVLSRTFVREREFGVWTAMLMTPAPRAALYLGKMLGTLVFLFAMEIALIPLIQLFFRAPLMQNIVSLLPILLLGTLGYAAVGTLFAAMTVRTRMRDLLLGVIVYPLVAPILIAAVKATATVLVEGSLGEAMGYLKLLGAIDILFVVGGLWLFGPLMED